MNNIAIIGSPGSGKTELAKWYVSFLDKDGARASLLDIDDDVLTPLTVRNIALGLSMSEGISYSEALVRSMARSSHAVASLVEASSSTKEFLDIEARMTHRYRFEKLQNTVISMTGSNPLDDSVMQRMQSNATIVYLDTPDEIVVKRLEEKLGATGIGRIVGIKEHGSLEAVLKYRRQFYEKWADVVFTPTATHSPEATTREFILWRQSQSLIPQMRRVG